MHSILQLLATKYYDPSKYDGFVVGSALSLIFHQVQTTSEVQWRPVSIPLWNLVLKIVLFFSYLRI